MTDLTILDKYREDPERDISDYAPHVEEVVGLIPDGTAAEIIESELRRNVDYYRLTISDAKRRVVRLHGGSADAIVGNLTFTKLADISDEGIDYNVRGEIIDTAISERGKKDDGTPRIVTEAIIEDQSGSMKVIIWEEKELIVGNYYAFKRCRFNKRYDNLSTNYGSNVKDIGSAKDNPELTIRNSVPPMNIRDIDANSNGKTIRAMVMSASESVARNGNRYKRVVLEDETGSGTFYDWENRDYTIGDTITITRIEVNESNGKLFMKIGKNSKITRG